MIGNFLKGSRGPRANDSRYLLDVHRRDLPGQDTMRREIEMTLAAIGAHLEPGFEVVAQAAGLDDVMGTVDLVVTGEGKLDATSFEGKVVGGVLEWAAEEGIEHRAVIVGQAADDAREELSVIGHVGLYVLTDRVWQAGEAYARAATLVEEAAIEAARAAFD